MNSDKPHHLISGSITAVVGENVAGAPTPGIGSHGTPPGPPPTNVTGDHDHPTTHAHPDKRDRSPAPTLPLALACLAAAVRALAAASGNSAADALAERAETFVGGAK